MTTIYLVRHAQSKGNEAHRLVGHIDNDVSELGMTELDRLAERFKDISFDAIYTSPLTRTRKTAEAVNRYHDAPITVDERLIELFIGMWEGQSWDDLPLLYPTLYNKVWRGTMYDFAAPQGEEMEHCYRRMSEAVDEIAKKNDGGTVVITSHGCALRNFYTYAAYGDIHMMPKSPFWKNTAVSKAIYDNEKYSFEFVNDYSHIKDLVD